jgi:ABC-type bacteriocin/lantibiotic exporter with double-glycine peptidase domain
MTSEQSAPVEKDSEIALASALQEKNSQNLDLNLYDTQILDCLQYLLRFHGIEKSVASIRDIAEVSEGTFDFSDAVSVLRNLDFSANVGLLSMSKLNRGHCPSIIKHKNGSISVLVEITPDNEYYVYSGNSDEPLKKFTKREFGADFSKSILLAKSPRQEDNEKQKKDRLVLGLTISK